MALDRDLARALSGQVAEQHRLAFARAFACAAIAACRVGLGLPEAAPPRDVELAALPDGTRDLARRIGGALAEAPAREAAHLAGVLYTSALPQSYRATHGIFYTPPPLVDELLRMADEAGVDWGRARVLDPAAGGGAFLLPVAQRMRAAMPRATPALALRQLATRLRGFELDPFGAFLCQSLLELALRDLIRAAGRPLPPLVEVRDSLELRPGELGRFDLVIGNPPYGRVSPPPARRAQYARGIYGHANLYGLFTDAATRWARPGGVVGYVTPASMLSGLYYKALRGLLAETAPPLAINFVSERDGVFDDVLQETILATYRRAGRPAGGTGRVGFIAVGAGGATSLSRGDAFALPADPAAPWLLPRAPDQVALAARLREMPHRLADYGYGVSTGPLVWNRFKDQFRATRDPGREGGCHPVIWAESVTSDGRFLWRSEKRNHAPWFAARRPKDDWLIVTRPCVLLQRTTAKEQSRRLIAAELPDSFIRRHKGVVVENHLNMVRAIVPAPAVPAGVIAALLNSASVDAAFRCINGSVAVSAFELESLPLPPPDVLTQLAALVAAGAPTAPLLARAYGPGDAAGSA